MTITPEFIQQQLQSENVGDRLRAVNDLRHLDPAIAFQLIPTAIKDQSARVRYAAVSQIASLGVQDRAMALSLLRDRLHNDSEADVQAAAADGLAALKLTEAFDDLRQKYETTQEWLIKFSIVAALGEMGDPRAFAVLEDALLNGEQLVKTVAISALGELGDRRAIPLLLPYATDPDWQIRHRLTQALGTLGGSEVRATLEQLATDEMEIVAQSAQVHLQQI